MSDTQTATKTSRMSNLKRRLSTLKRRRKSGSKSSQSAEQFIIEHRRAQQANCRVQPTQDLCRRAVFVSLMGLHQSWRDCPSVVLYSSILLLPLKREWVYASAKGKKRDEEHKEHDFGRLLSDSDFVQLLQWKDKQGLAFWMKDQIASTESESDNRDEVNAVAPFWSMLSDALSRLFDPVRGCNYEPLLTSASSFAESKQEFGATREEIAQELSGLTMRFKSISEVLFQSNPTLDIVTSYVGGCPLRLSPTVSASKTSCVSDNEEEDATWWIAEDYECEDGSDAELPEVTEYRVSSTPSA